MNESKLKSFYKLTVIVITAQIMLSACATKKPVAEIIDQAEQAPQKAVAVVNRPLTRDEILAAYDAQSSDISVANVPQAIEVSPTLQESIQPVVIPQAIDPQQPKVVIREMQVQEPEVIKSQAVAAKPKPVSAKPIPTGDKNCPAEKIYGKWMSQEVRQGSNNEVIPAAIGYMFREDGFFATALFNVITGEKQGEFEGSYRTVKGKQGKCAVEFSVPSRGILNRLDYQIKSGVMEVDDKSSDSRALLERI
jgi:hypothetical protein